MGKFFAAAAIAGSVLLGSVLPSSAATTALGALSDGDSPFITGSNPKNTTFTDLFTFSVDVKSTVSASITNTGAVIANFIMKLYTGSDPATGTLVATSNTDTTKPQTLQFGTLTNVEVAAGDYVVAVSGTTGLNNNKNTSYGGNLSVSAVPLPSSVALFGVAVLGLGLAGFASRKNTSAAAKA